MNQYVERVNHDLSPGPGPNDEIFFKGRKFPDGTSRFIKLYLGIREIRGVPKHVAERLKLENPENYTSKYLLKFEKFTNTIVQKQIDTNLPNFRTFISSYTKELERPNHSYQILPEFHTFPEPKH